MGRTVTLPLFLVTLSLAGATLGRASTVTVPDDHPTIQLALDSLADTVRIRAGNYPERPSFLRHKRPEEWVVIEGLPESGLRPRMEGLIVEGPYGALAVSGCAFSGGVDLNPGAGGSTVTFDSCDLDSGVVQHVEDSHDYGYLAITRSRVRGPIDSHAEVTVCAADTFETFGVAAGGESQLTVTNCFFQGPGGRAVSATGMGSAHIAGNSIDGYANAISVGGEGTWVIEYNHVRRCDVGIAFERNSEIRGNQILDCGRGILGNIEDAVPVRDNIVLGSSVLGISLSISSSSPVVLQGNVVGRTMGDGFRIEPSGPDSRVILVGNTSFRNTGAGFRIVADAPGGPYDLTLDHNIAFENGTYGVDADTSATPDGCNDWYGNVLGATRGVTLSGTDLAVDPVFCDVDHDSVSLAANSPLLAAAGCGLIGARGQGCVSSADVGTATAGGFRLVRVSPNPGSGPLRIDFVVEREAAVSIDVYDLQGRLVASPLRGMTSPGVRSATWAGNGHPGLHFVRYRYPGGQQTRAVVVVR